MSSSGDPDGSRSPDGSWTGSRSRDAALQRRVEAVERHLIGALGPNAVRDVSVRDGALRVSVADPELQRRARELVARLYSPAASMNPVSEKTAARHDAIPSSYMEPHDAAPPDMAEPWRMYVVRKHSPHKDATVLTLSRRWYMFGRDKSSVHVTLGHQSCSKLHAVVQFRVASRHPRTESHELELAPWIMDMSSRNGTYLNGHRAPKEKFVPLKSGDSITFGIAGAEWIVVHEASSPPKDEATKFLV